MVLGLSYPVFHLPQGDAILVPECWGYRSCVSLVILITAYCLWNSLPILKVLKYFILSVVYAVVFNALRISVCLCVGYFAYGFAFGPLHDIFGYITFILALFTLVGQIDDEIAKNKK